MKTLKNGIGLKVLTFLTISCALLLDSCSKSNDSSILSTTDTQSVNSESASDSYASDATDMSNVSVGNISNSTYAGPARMEATINLDTLKNLDDRFKCATITLVRTGTKTSPAGVITIDFSAAGCTDARGVTRKGQIIVTYVGRRFISGSTIVTTFNGYSRNDVKVEGTVTLTNVQVNITDNPKYSVVIAGGKITFTDGKTITREQNFTYEWQRASNPTQDKLVISKGGAATGSNKAGVSYTMSITADLVYSRACQISNKVFIAVSGTKVFTVNGRQYTVDYGSGDCDNDVTVSVNGASKTITVSADGN